MGVFRRAAPWLFAVLFLTGCASSNVTAYQPMQGKIDRPDRIIVYDFAATAAELPPEVAIAGQGAVSPPATPAQLTVARRLGAETARKLVAELQGMGLPAVQATGQPAPRVGDGLVVGYFTTVDPGSATERVAIGFGEGGAQLKTVVKGYLMTAQGLRPRLGRGGGGQRQDAGRCDPAGCRRRHRQSRRAGGCRRCQGLRRAVGLRDH